jgi:hypothetical protein
VLVIGPTNAKSKKSVTETALWKKALKRHCGKKRCNCDAAKKAHFLVCCLRRFGKKPGRR